MVIKLLLVAAVIIGAFLAYVALKPSAYVITRELVVNAPVQVIFPYLNNSKKANEWMPWAQLDPQLTMSFSGPDEGVGSKASWVSTGRMGTGNAVIAESVTDKVVRTNLTQLKPFQMSQLAEMSLTPAGSGTLVRWSVSGHNNFMGRLMCTFMNMDKMVGGSFELGLANLKRLTETKP